MSQVDDLIAVLCPDGVPYHRLAAVARIRNGKDYRPFGAGDVPVYGSGGVMTRIDTAAHAGPSVLIPRKGSLDKLYFVNEPFWTVDTIFYTEIDASLMAPKFFYYFLATQHLEDLNPAGGIPSLTQSVLNEVRLPVPPLEVQREIVRVLDTFTELAAGLEAELEARRRQYEHYRDLLLTFQQEGVRWVPLGELVRINFGTRITKAKDVGTLYPVYGGGGESFRTDAYNRADEWVISRFAMSERCVRRVRGRFWMLDSGFTFDVIAPDLEKDYVGQLLLKMQPVIFMTSTQSAQKNIDIDGFQRLVIPVPPLGDQERIVAILDKFDELVNDLSIGLPAELNARRKQYEHYRDRLLTFPEAA